MKKFLVFEKIEPYLTQKVLECFLSSMDCVRINNNETCRNSQKLQLFLSMTVTFELVDKVRRDETS